MELVSQLRVVLTKCWIHRRWGVLASFLVLGLGLGGIKVLPDIYRSETTIYVDTSTMLARTLRGLSAERTVVNDEFLIMAQNLLLSEPNLVRVAQENGLGNVISNSSDRSQVLALLQQVEFQSRNVGPQRRSSQKIVRIAYESVSPQLSLGVVSSLSSILHESMVGSSQRDARVTEEFLSKRVSEQSIVLEQAETALQEFKKEHIGLLPEDDRDFFREIDETRELHRQSTLELEQNENERSELIRQIERLASTGIDSERMKELESRLIELQMRYTEQHPEVISLKNVIKNMNEQGIAGREDAIGLAETSGNPVLEELRVELSRKDSAVSSIKANLSALTERLAQLELAMDSIPEIQAEYSRLTRDADFHNQQYAGLLGRLEATRLAIVPNESESGVVFEIVEAPVLATNPIAPKRLELSVMVLLFSLGCGLASSFLVSLLAPTISGPRELSQTSSFPVLGSISVCDAPSPLGGYVLFGLSLMLLISAYLAFVIMFVL